MPISVTCQCGAKLEIDEKFLGKEVLCPDCQRPLPTKPASGPPPLDLPDYRRTDGLAVLSLTLALVGAFTIVGTMAAVVIGFLSLNRIAGKAGKLSGRPLALAGVVLGISFTLFTLAAFLSPSVLGLDVFLRRLAYGSRTTYPADKRIEMTLGTSEMRITLPSSRWGRYSGGTQQNSGFQSDGIMLVNIREDAFISCQDVDLDMGQNRDQDELQKKVLERLQKSELVNVVGRLGRNPAPEPLVVDKKPVGGDGVQELIVAMRLGGHDRRMLVLYRVNTLIKAFIFVGCARTNRFDRIQEELREGFKTFDFKE